MCIRDSIYIVPSFLSQIGWLRLSGCYGHRLFVIPSYFQAHAEFFWAISRFLVHREIASQTVSVTVKPWELEGLQVELSSKEHDIPNLSDYAKNLGKNVKSRYLEKISLVRIDPATPIGANLDPEWFPLIEATDLLCYLVMDTSFYTKE